MTLLPLAILLAVANFALAQDLLSVARELFYTTNYEEALAVLDRLPTDALTPPELQDARGYRALCLFALRRTPEVERTLSQIIYADPFYRPPAERFPPRLLEAFARQQRHVLPLLAREHYRTVERDVGEGRLTEAIAGLETILRFADEIVALPEEDASPQLTEVADRAARRLAEIRHAPPTRPLPARPILSPNHPLVTRPVAIRQEIPAWKPEASQSATHEGRLELVISTSGDVISARLVVPIHPAYDQVLLDAARKWKYTPAHVDGKPVEYTETVTILLAPTRGPARGAPHRP